MLNLHSATSNLLKKINFYFFFYPGKTQEESWPNIFNMQFEANQSEGDQSEGKASVQANLNMNTFIWISMW